MGRNLNIAGNPERSPLQGQLHEAESISVFEKHAKYIRTAVLLGLATMASWLTASEAQAQQAPAKTGKCCCDCPEQPCPATAADSTGKPKSLKKPSCEQIRKPYDPGTFFVDKPDTGVSMGKGSPRGFDMAKNSNKITFFVTGHESGKTKVQLYLYPNVKVDKAKRTADTSTPAQITITIDDEKIILFPEEFPAGSIIPSTKWDADPTLDDEIHDYRGLWSTPICLGPIPIPPGHHEIIVESTGFGILGFRAVLTGAVETVKPDNPPALDIPFEEDPDFPPEFRLQGKVTHAEKAGKYKLEVISKEIDVTAEEFLVTPLPDSKLVKVTYRKTAPIYEATLPLKRFTPHNITFRRVLPPAYSTDYDGPEQIPVDLTITGDTTAGYTATPAAAADGSSILLKMTCQTNKVAKSSPKRAHHYYCSEKIKTGVQRAYRTVLDTRPLPPSWGSSRRHWLKKY